MSMISTADDACRRRDPRDGSETTAECSRTRVVDSWGALEVGVAAGRGARQFFCDVGRGGEPRFVNGVANFRETGSSGTMTAFGSLCSGGVVMCLVRVGTASLS